jgi:uncharacterized protein Yka (UPF0111/DUF47 family)/predicted NUDIX family NTP pyrophosphohydrolase
LITSRDTGRWVIPKGNRMRGLDDHAAAGREAWEEAGAIGDPCPTPIGSFRYLKRRPSGDTTAEVVVFPLAVREQAADWPERGQRTIKWFPVADAAEQVAEGGLKQLINNFANSPDGSNAPAAASTGRTGMAGWFQKLLPSQGRFFEQFEEHAATLVAGSDALARLLRADGDRGTAIHKIQDEEHKADDIIRDVLTDLRKVFVTPFDRSAITALIGAMDDAIDEMNATAKSAELYEVSTFEPGMRDIAAIVVEAARVTQEAVPLLRNLGKNAGRLTELTARLVELEGHADDIHATGLKALYKSHGADAPMKFVVGREIYSHLEKVVDRFEDVADAIQGLVIDHA